MPVAVISVRVVPVWMICPRRIIRVVPWIIPPAPTHVPVIARKVRVRIIRRTPEVVSHVNACSIVVRISGIPICICIEVIIITVSRNVVMESS
jgi:hypothetical protein